MGDLLPRYSIAWWSGLGSLYYRKFCCQWISLRENRNRKPWIFPLRSWGFPVNFPLNQSIGIGDNGFKNGLFSSGRLSPITRGCDVLKLGSGWIYGFLVISSQLGEWFQLLFLVGDFKHLLFSISYMGCHPSHCRTPSFFRGVGIPPTRFCFPTWLSCWCPGSSLITS